MVDSASALRSKGRRWALLLLIVLLAAVTVWSWQWQQRSVSADGVCLLMYQIEAQTLRISTPGGETHHFENVVSGDGLVESIARRSRGPIPPGAYLVLTRDEGRPSYHGQPAFLLDPIDAWPANDRIDGWDLSAGGGRSAFRIHGGMATQGCLASREIDEIAKLLLRYASRNRFDVYSFPADSGRPGIRRFRLSEEGDRWVESPNDGDWELFEAEACVGVLRVFP